MWRDCGCGCGCSGNCGCNSFAQPCPPACPPSSVLTPYTLTLNNGANPDVHINLAGSLFVTIIGPSGPFSIGGLNNRPGGTSWPGSVLVLFNSSMQQMTLNVEDPANPFTGDRINTLTTANIVLRLGQSCATVIYDPASLRWIVTSTN